MGRILFCGDNVKKTFVDMLQAGQAVDDVFIVQDKQLGHKRNGEPFLTFHLTDRTGEIKAVVWENVEAVKGQLSTGDYARVQGTVGTYGGSPQVVVQRIEASDPRKLDVKDFLPSTDRDIDQMFRRLRELTRTVGNEHLSKLLAAFFEDEEFVASFKKAPAAKKMHHAYLGGLLEHTLSIARLIEAISGHYKGIDRDLLMAGGLLHDIGKIHELSYETHIEYSDTGRLLSHIVIGTEMLEKKLQGIEGFPEELALLLKHMIVSHHGTREFGSPEPPMTLEAVVLYYLDDLDAKVTGIRTFMDREEGDAAWTSYHRVLERFFYKGKERRDGGE
jgi:3'-5' exoribonuclease